MLNFPVHTLEQIHLELQGFSTLIIDAGGIGTPYHTTADLPPVDAGSMQSTFRNGVLEVTFRILPEASDLLNKFLFFPVLPYSHIDQPDLTLLNSSCCHSRDSSG